jgi:pyridoxal phosphate enzyme (YggS family)
MYKDLLATADSHNATLVAVSKTKPISEIQALYEQGHRDFGENYVQELVEKHEQLPKDIRWHYIGTLQRNKVKYIAPFVHLIHAVDSLKLLAEISKRARQHGRMIDVLLQVHIAEEDTKHGLDRQELLDLLQNQELHRQAWARVSGLMGMATFTEDEAQVGREFAGLKQLFDHIGENYYARRSDWSTLSMGMSSDYKLALANGSNMLRIGSLIFGARD